jgi:predicted neutral ceramidase superfamily lipid hydrolase
LHQLFDIDTINPFYLIVGTFTGACLLASFLLSIVAITRPVYRNKLLIAFNWTLVVNMCVATAVSKADLDLLSQC